MSALVLTDAAFAPSAMQAASARMIYRGFEYAWAPGQPVSRSPGELRYRGVGYRLRAAEPARVARRSMTYRGIAYTA